MFCEDGDVRTCASDGSASTLTEACGTGEYCAAGDPATCQPQICVPDTPGCNGNSVARCNADGSGFVSAGTSCGSETCSAGVCRAFLFQEDFEDGDRAGWTVSTSIPIYSTLTGTVVTTEAASGTAQSLELVGQSFIGAMQGTASITVPAMAPSAVSFWVRAGSTTAQHRLSLGTALSVGLDSAGGFYGTGGSSTYQADRWYHFEVRDIDWVQGTYSAFIDGVLQARGIAFTPPATGTVTSVRLLMMGNAGPYTAYWDEIELH